MKTLLILLTISVTAAILLVGALVLDTQLAQGNHQAEIVRVFIFPL